MHVSSRNLIRKGICFFLSILLFAHECLASSCCGSSVSIPALITTGERMKFLVSFSGTERMFRISPEGKAIRLSRLNQLQVLRSQISAGYKTSNELQVFTRITRFDRGSGDTDVGVGREFKLFEDVQSFAWFQVTLPTGLSVYEITDPQKEPTGSGFVIPGFGLSLNTTRARWDLSSTFFLGEGLRKRFNGQLVTPGLQSYAQVAIGRNWNQWRVGLSLEHQREEGKRIQMNGRSVDSFSWPISLTVSYLHKGDIWTATLMDETLIGPTRNTYLNHGITVSYMKRVF